MTDLEKRLRRLADQPVPEPTGVEPLAKRARRLRRRRRSLRATGAVLGLLLVTGAVLSIAGMLAPRPSIVLGPGDDRSQAGVPEGWQTVAVGAAALSVPADWPVTDVKVQGPIPHPEPIFRSGPAVYVADQLYQPPGPPAPDDAPARKPGVYALPAHGDPEQARWLADEGTPITINEQEAIWAATEDFRWYAFPALDLLLWVSYDPDPALMDQVLATVRRAEGADVDEPAADDQEGVVRADTPDGAAAMELVVDRGVLRSDEQVAFRLVNRGQLDLLTGAPFGVQRWDGQAWRTLPMDQIWPSYGFVFAPGEQSVEQRWPTDEALWTAPGWHRIVKSASYEAPEHGQPDPELQARTRFRVIGAPDPRPQPGTDTRESTEE